MVNGFVETFHFNILVEYPNQHPSPPSHSNSLFLLLVGRDRWVYYARKDYDASQVPPEW